MKDFYLTLISNSSMNYFPENKTNTFTVHLPSYISLSGQWEVALVEIHYPFTLFNITENNNTIYVKYHNDSDNVHVEKLDTGYYDNIHDLIQIINAKLKPHTDNKELISLDRVTKRVIINQIFEENTDSNKNVIDKSKKTLFSICFESRLAMQMGFAPEQNILAYNLSPHAVNIAIGVPEQFFVYCDIIDTQIIGDISAKVLRIINTADGSVKSFAQPCHKEFNLSHYVKVNDKKFQKVSIDIRDVAGNFLPFQFGVLTVKLHFKRENSSLNDGRYIH